MNAKITYLNRIWDKAEHNAFPDLIRYNGHFFCSFREGDAHAGGKNGKVRILISKNGKRWKPVALISLKGIDLRDPMLSEMPDGRLMLTMGGSIYKKDKLKNCYSCVAFSKDGTKWSHVKRLDMPWTWIWRLTWHKGVGYGFSYGKIDKKRWGIKLFKTINGLNYDLIVQPKLTKSPSEVTLRFLDDDTMVALVRRHAPGMIGTAKPPYQKWKWHEIRERVGGPNFLILDGDDMWSAGRLYRTVRGKKRTYTALFKMTKSSIKPVLKFPSSGDTSYPGMVYYRNLLYVSYYSSHEGKSMIYFSIIKGP